MEFFEVSADVHALIEDLLPVINPAARFEAPLARVVLPVGRFEPSATTWTVLERCARAERTAWPRLVEDWLREVGDLAAMAIAEIELLGDVRKLLRLRIVPKLTEAEREGLLVTSAGDHFDAMVVIEHPEYGGPLTRARASLLGLRRLGDIAVPNTYEGELADVGVHDQPLTASESVRVVSKPGCRYVSSLITEVDRFIPDAGKPGALLAVPSHSTLLLYPIVSAGMGDVLDVFSQVVREMHANADDPSSPEVFWWRRGRALRRLDPAAADRFDPIRSATPPAASAPAASASASRSWRRRSWTPWRRR
ncbi:hypothetical protein AGRA3207_005466 [Actinomadura graeca]|uniref:Uncharacterized protein n=1 Tax=Actinomadura graeca TaxID=2750812 RepID=A0ABX8R3C4_9ACTN|nr:hypothetical protein [Actinomadura graeca]QXJ24192.1 hypothetical protein AGRA3207_005466 [Actinomadura graeca]